MKKLICSLVCLLSVSANAKEFKIAELGYYQVATSDVREEFEINEELGRAWVKLTANKRFDYESDSEEYRVKVPGLSFDVDSKTIVLDYEGQIIDCVQMITKGRGIFRRTIMKETGRCEFVQRWVTVTYDDGFEIRKTQKLHIFLNVE